ncbi:MAG: alkaline shock response membrane anchor protein AmaP [Candidatus Omnitrophica bacterium]|nr:alkaline shock response membrane anchor protein AmaP [Candidatus Omnitrophota bacterium]MCM8816864.1 alkaline shock response membrane anchor protein AmaP [Candidatus Omnitrophota bacterium]
MRIFTKIIQTIFILLGIATLGLLALFWIKPEIIVKVSHFIETNLLKTGITSLSVILVGIIWLVYWTDYVIRTKSISLDNPHGKVRISLKAIEEFISTKLTSQMPNIKSMQVKSTIGSHGLETLIQMKITGGYNIPEFTSQVQELIKNYLEDVVGVERVSHIEIFVTSISPTSEHTTDIEEKHEETTTHH